MKKYDTSILLPTLSIDDLESVGLDPSSLDDLLDNEAWEKLINEMPQKYVELLICLYLGLKGKEICQVLGYKTFTAYIQSKQGLREFYRKRKDFDIISYN